jgi:hypothetical protein
MLTLCPCLAVMTGTNLHMTKLTDIATNVDGTSETSYSWTCPEVSPYSGESGLASPKAQC